MNYTKLQSDLLLFTVRQVCEHNTLRDAQKLHIYVQFRAVGLRFFVTFTHKEHFEHIGCEQ